VAGNFADPAIILPTRKGVEMMLKFAPLLLAAPLTINALAAPESFTVDPDHTFPYFGISHLGFSTLHARFNKTAGNFTLDPAARTGSIELTVDSSSVDTGQAKRDTHLRSADFFNAKEFPVITFKSSKITFDGDKVVGVDGELTLLGVTKPMMFKVDAMNCGPNPMDKKQYRCGFDATGAIKRSDFGMKYALPAIGDDVKFTMEVEGIRSP
jgi:polyisoprenoid-binding protein YceI